MTRSSGRKVKIDRASRAALGANDAWGIIGIEMVCQQKTEMLGK